MEHRDYLQVTMNWVQTFVVNLNLCPFAGNSILNKKLSQRLILSASLEQILTELFLEVDLMEKNLDLESSLVTVPNAPSNFKDYLDILEKANELLTISGFEGVYQLASFHPGYQFAGTTLDAAENFTNRSPYPVFHIIRESSLSKAIDSFPGIEDIPNNNIEKMNSMGIQKLKELLQTVNPHF